MQKPAAKNGLVYALESEAGAQYPLRLFYIRR